MALAFISSKKSNSFSCSFQIQQRLPSWLLGLGPAAYDLLGCEWNWKCLCVRAFNARFSSIAFWKRGASGVALGG